MVLRAFTLGCWLLATALPAAGLAGEAHLSDPEALPEQSVDPALGDIAEAWLIVPTARYDHHVRPTRYEAGGLRVKTTDGQTLSLVLDETHVFEDRHARLADFGNDGHAEIAVVLSNTGTGASLALYGLEDGDIVRKAQTPHIGTSHRWLNPAGIADFDGDGRLEIALVFMPHLEKRLELWGFDPEGRFVQEARIGDVSNHRNGSRWSKMSAQADFNKDGAIDLVIPSGDRKAVRVLGFAGDTPTELDRTALPFAADGHFELFMEAGELTLSLGLETAYPAQVWFCNFSTRC